MRKNPDAKEREAVHIYQKDEVNLGNLHDKIHSLERQGRFEHSTFNVMSQTFGRFYPPSAGDVEPTWTTQRFVLAAFMFGVFLTFVLLGILE
ncbi:MAG: hypothetical protein RLZZ488_2630 [Pseudomonadota bacterium]